MNSAGSGVRDVAVARPLVESIVANGGKAYAAQLDLADLRPIERFASAEARHPLHLLINNADVMACPHLSIAQGFEMQLGVNHLGHFHVTSLLLPALKAANGVRVVNLLSSGHHWGDFDFADPQFENRNYDPLVAYGQAKTANVLFTLELDRQFRGESIRAFAVMPGGIRTSLGRYMTDDIRKRLGTDTEAARTIHWKTVEQGSATTLWAAFGEGLAETGGLYLEDCAEAVPWTEGMHNGVKAHALDQHNAARLWAWSKAAVAAVTWEAYTMKIDFDGKVALVTGVGAASADLSPQRQRSDRRDLVADRNHAWLAGMDGYAASKSGMNGLCRNLALEFAKL